MYECHISFVLLRLLFTALFSFSSSTHRLGWGGVTCDTSGGFYVSLVYFSVVFFVDQFPPIAAASMWTRKDIKDFKDSIRKDADSVIKVGSGETVTVSRCANSPPVFSKLLEMGASLLCRFKAENVELFIKGLPYQYRDITHKIRERFF